MWLGPVWSQGSLGEECRRVWFKEGDVTWKQRQRKEICRCYISGSEMEEGARSLGMQVSSRHWKRLGH